jgi:predicted nucleotidyltransferase
MVNTELILARNILKSNYDIDPNKVVGVYPYGSLVYETATENSDLDLIVIVDMIKNDYLQYESEDLDIHFVSENYFKTRLFQHDIMMLECFYNPNPFLKYETEFELDKSKLRSVISSKSNNSWAKAGKKLDLSEEDDFIGLKSLFHSLRLLSFGIDLAQDGKIYYNYVGGDNARNLLDTIISEYNKGDRWEELKTKYKPIYNSLATDFRKVAPKNS